MRQPLSQVTLVVGLISVLYSIHPACGFSVQIRQSNLYSHDGNHLLGSVLERRTSDSHEATIKVPEEADEDFQVTLPFVETADSVGSSLWPSSLVGSILLHGSKSITEGKHVLELGSGLGLGGLVAGRCAARCSLTDNEEDLVASLQEHIDSMLDCSHLTATFLDWRDSTVDPSEENSFDVCLGFDVAYYYHLIAPIINTVRLKQKKNKSLLMVIGQSNRESQWQLYHHIRDGGYNQVTDETDAPWDGETRMILYNMEMGEWQPEEEETMKVGGVVPIAALLHTTEDLQLDALTAHDYMATQEDEESQMMSF